MKKIILAVTFVLSAVGLAESQQQTPCRNGEVRGCSANGRPGRQTCDGAVWSACAANRTPPPPPPPPVTGTITPRYYILTVIYAPPGTNGGKSSSSVNYSSGSTAGSTVSASDSFKQGNSVTATAEGGFLGNGGSVEASFGVTQSSSNGSSLEIKKSATSEINDVGPAADGINHDHDLIYLWLNPAFQLKLFPTASGTVASANWQPLNTGQTVITYLYVGWLKNPAQMPPGEMQLLQRYGITTADFPVMLNVDPYWRTPRLTAVSAIGNATPDARRFQPLYTTFPYEPPYGPSDPVPTYKFTASYSNTSTTSASAQTEYTVGLKVGAEGGFPGLAKLSLKDSLNWTWTSTTTHSSSSGTTESAAVTVGGPAYGYQGSLADIAVYYDLIYRTFLFVPLPSGSPSIEGTVSAGGATAPAGREVIVVANGIRYRTFTNAKGLYRVYGNISGRLRIQSGTLVRDLPQLPTTRKVDIEVPR